jgi:solute carrier family 45 protein 1/2/4
LVSHANEPIASDQYSSANESTSTRETKKSSEKRGLGTDLSLVSSMVFVAQFFLSFFIGSLMKLIGSKSVVIYAASFLSLTASFTATKLLYFD